MSHCNWGITCKDPLVDVKICIIIEPKTRLFIFLRSWSFRTADYEEWALFWIRIKAFQTVVTVVITWFKLCNSLLHQTLDKTLTRSLYTFLFCFFDVEWSRVTPEEPPPPLSFITATVGCHGVYAQQTDWTSFSALSLPSSLFSSSSATHLMSHSFRHSLVFHLSSPLPFSFCSPSHPLCPVSIPIIASLLLLPYVFLHPSPPLSSLLCVWCSPHSEAQKLSQRGDCPGRHQIGGGSPVWGSGGQTSSHHQVVGVSRRKPLN